MIITKWVDVCLCSLIRLRCLPNKQVIKNNSAMAEPGTYFFYNFVVKNVFCQYLYTI